MKIIAVFALAAALGGCATFSSGPVEVSSLVAMQSGPREITIINSTPYLAEMTVAFAAQGIVLKPAPSEGSVTTPGTDGTTSLRKKASTRYGLDLQVAPTRQICAFTDYRIVNAKATVIDLSTNTVAAVVSQRGSDGPCTTVDPVYLGLAAGVAGLFR